MEETKMLEILNKLSNLLQLNCLYEAREMIDFEIKNLTK